MLFRSQRGRFVDLNYPDYNILKLPFADGTFDLLTGDKASFKGVSPLHPFDAKADINHRAKTYLQVNCAMCHVTDGGGNSQMELGYRTPIDKAESIKIQHGSALASMVSGDEVVSVSGVGGQPGA